MPDATIPVFNVIPDEKAFQKACAQLRKGAGAYDASDAFVMANWIGVCAFTYLADDYQKKNEKSILTADDLQKKDFYSNQCHHVSSITNDILRRLDVASIHCDTSEVCEERLTHCGVIGLFDTKQGRQGILFDHSIRQFFQTNTQGILQNPHNITGKTISNAAYVPLYTFANENRKNLVRDLLESGSAYVNHDADLENYVGIFMESLADVCSDYKPDRLTLRERTQQFVRRFTSPISSNFATWSVLPDENDGKEILRRYTDIYTRCIASPA